MSKSFDLRRARPWEVALTVFALSAPFVLPLAMRQSMNLMVSGRPGPVHLDVPYDVFQEEAEVTVTPSDARSTTSRVRNSLKLA